MHNVFHAPRAPTVHRKGSGNVAQVEKRKGMQAELKILLSLGQVLSLVGPTFQVSKVKTAGLRIGGSSSTAGPPRLSLPSFTARAIRQRHVNPELSLQLADLDPRPVSRHGGEAQLPRTRCVRARELELPAQLRLGHRLPAALRHAARRRYHGQGGRNLAHARYFGAGP